MKSLLEYLRRVRKTALLFFLCFVIMATVLFLYDLPVEAVFYGGLLCVIAGIVFLFFGYVNYRDRKKKPAGGTEESAGGAAEAASSF